MGVRLDDSRTMLGDAQTRPQPQPQPHLDLHHFAHYTRHLSHPPTGPMRPRIPRGGSSTTSTVANPAKQRSYAYTTATSVSPRRGRGWLLCPASERKLNHAGGERSQASWTDTGGDQTGRERVEQLRDLQAGSREKQLGDRGEASCFADHGM
jgi:hypothetical protein